MTARHVDDREARDLLQLLADERDRIPCPICRHTHCLTDTGRIWTHGPLAARCRGSRVRPGAAAWAARTIRGITTIHLPGETP